MSLTNSERFQFFAAEMMNGNYSHHREASECWCAAKQPQYHQMEYNQAFKIASDALELLKPFCERIEIAGSIRRKCPEVGDVELVCIPKQEITSISLFGVEESKPVEDFCRIVNSWERLSGDPTGRMCKRMLPGRIKLDLFICRPENWGYIFAIRTGSANYSHKSLAHGWTRLGYKGEDGMLTKDGIAIELREEKDLFELLGYEILPPEKRNW